MDFFTASTWKQRFSTGKASDFPELVYLTAIVCLLALLAKAEGGEN